MLHQKKKSLKAVKVTWVPKLTAHQELTPDKVKRLHIDEKNQTDGDQVYDVRVLYSQLLAEASDLGLGVCQLHTEVLPALGAPHVGRVTGGLGAGWQRRRRGTLTAVSLLGQLHDRLRSETSRYSNHN